MYKKYCHVFVHVNKYFEYLLENPIYMDETIFMMQHLGRCELAFKHNLNVIHARTKWRWSGELGGWRKMGKTNEMFWFHKGNIYSLVQNYNYSK